jgi:hypothetical protein
MTSKDHKTTSPEDFSKVVLSRLVCKEHQNRQPHHHYVMIHNPGRPQKHDSLKIFCTTNPQTLRNPNIRVPLADQKKRMKNPITTHIFQIKTFRNAF